MADCTEFISTLKLKHNDRILKEAESEVPLLQEKSEQFFLRELKQEIISLFFFCLSYFNAQGQY